MEHVWVLSLGEQALRSDPKLSRNRSRSRSRSGSGNFGLG